MRDQKTSMGGLNSKFPATHQSLLQRARAVDPDVRRMAFDELVKAYWRPLYIFLWYRGTRNEDAKDLVGGVFTSLIEKSAIEKFDARQGRFRTWLLACLKHFAADEYDKQHAGKRYNGLPMISIDGDEEKEMLELKSQGVSPEQAFDRAWAREKLDRAFAQVRALLDQDGKLAHRKLLDVYLDADNVARPDYRRLSELTGLNQNGVRHGLEDLRALLRDAILQEVTAETATAEEAADEVAQLLACLGKR